MELVAAVDPGQTFKLIPIESHTRPNAGRHDPTFDGPERALQ